MPRGTTSPAFIRDRFFGAALVIGGHIALLALLTRINQRESETRADERMTLVFIDLPDEHSERDSAKTTTSAIARARAGRTTAASPTIVDTTTITQEPPDWYDEARRAVARQAGAPEIRSFDFPKREPPPREKQKFGWDKVHTERIAQLPGGGTLVRLSDHCSLVLAPLPLGGCSLGKRKPRGDLFDEMNAAADPGDWK